MIEVAAAASSPTSTASPLSSTSTTGRLEEASAGVDNRGRKQQPPLAAQPSVRGTRAPSPKGSGEKPPVMDDEAIDAEAGREDDSFFSGYHCFACCYGLPSWLQYFSYVLGGCFILLFPAIVVYVVAYTRFEGFVRPIDGQVATWSFFFAGMWALLLTLWRVIGMLPLIMTSIIILVFKRCPENVRLALEFISALQSWATYAAWSILNVILFQLLFLSPLVSPYYAGNYTETKYLLDVYATLFAVLTTIMVLCLFVFVQKLFLHSIAVNFHRSAYAERMQASRKSFLVMDKLRKAIRLFDFPDVIAKVGSSAADAASASSAFLLRGGKSTSDDLDSGHHQGKLKEGEKRNSSFWFSPRTPRKPLEGKQTEGAAATSPLATGTPVVQVTDPPKPAPVEMTIVNIMTDPLPYIPPPIQTASGSDVPLPAPSGLRSRTPSSAPKAEMTTLLSAMNSPAGGSSPSESATVTHLPVTLSKTASSTAPRPVDNAPPVHPSGTLGRAASTTPPAPTADNIAKSSAIRASALKKLNPFVQLFKEFTSAQYTKLTVNLDISNDKQARKLANQLHMSLAGAKDKEITPHDFATLFDSEEDLKAAFEIFDTDKNGSLSREEMRTAVVTIYRERRALDRSLRGFSQSLGKLDTFFYVISGLATLIVVLPVWGIPLTAILPFVSLLIALSFIFGGSVKSMFDSLIFIFVFHPYDTGDRISVDKESYIVDSVALLTTTLINSDGQYVCAPNTVLMTKNIHNFRRSGDQSESIEIQFDFYTPEAKLKALEKRMREYVVSQKRDLHSNTDLTIASIENMSKLLCKFTIKHKGNWQDMGRKLARRNQFMFALVRACIDLDIQYALSPQWSMEQRESTIRQIKGSRIVPASTETQ